MSDDEFLFYEKISCHIIPSAMECFSFSDSKAKIRTSATLRKITDLRNFSHQYYAPLRTSVTLFEIRYGAP